MVLDISSNCRDLELLNVQHCDVSDESGKWVTSFPLDSGKLVSLDCRCIRGLVEQNDMVQLARRSPNLTTLSVNETLSHPRHLLQITRAATDLEMLGLLLNQYDDDGTTDCVLLSSQLHTLKSIRSVAMSDSPTAVLNSGVSPTFIRAFSPLQEQLLYLSFEGLSAIGFEDQVRFIVGCTALKGLHVSSRIGDAGLQGIGRFCKKLEELVVLDNDTPGYITECGFNDISKGCLQLKSLTIFCTRMRNASLVDFSEKHPDMRCFKMYANKYMLDYRTREPLTEGFKAILSLSSNLQKLRFPGPFTDELFDSIVENAKNIEVLQLSGAYKEGNSTEGLLRVLRGCKQLRKLSITSGAFGGDDLFRYQPMKSLFISRSGKQKIATDKTVRDTIHSVDTHYTRRDECMFNYVDVAVPATNVPNYQRVYLKNVA